MCTDEFLQLKCDVQIESFVVLSCR